MKPQQNCRGRVCDVRRQKIIFCNPSNIQSRAAHHPHTHGLNASASESPVGRRGEIRRRPSDSANRCSRRVRIACTSSQAGGTSGIDLTGLFERLGIAAAMRPRALWCSNGDEAVDEVAAGSPHHPPPALSSRC
jgi:hypothetical protein